MSRRVHGIYLEPWEDASGILVPPAATLRELLRHGLRDDDVQEFFEYFGFRSDYDAQETMNWLGH